MKLLKFSSYYLDFVNQAISRKPEIVNESYDSQLNYFFSFDFAWSDFWKKNIELDQPDISVTEVIFNIESLQKKWALEQGINTTEKWQREIVDAQIAFHKPDVIFFEDHIGKPAEFKRKFPFLKYIACWDGTVLMDPDRFAGADMLVTCHQGTLDFYKSLGINCYHFIFGFETTILKKLKPRPPQFDISFVGSLNLGRKGHLQRLNLFHELDKTLNINYWLSATAAPSIFSIPGLKNAAKGLIRDSIRLNGIIPKNKGQVFGLEMYQVMSDSKITINNHIDVAGRYAANMRLFEATGTGVCLVTDWKENLNDLFKIDEEVIAYKTADECIEKCLWLQNHESKRKEIAQAGQKRTLEQYSLKKRVLDFIRTIQY